MRNRFWRKNEALLLALGGVLAVCLVYSVGPPLLKLFAGDAADSLGRAGLLSAIWSRTLESVVALWLFMLGGAIGSFLNVVVWRMPLGMSIAAGGSRCPFCRTAILSSDNIPIFGWLKLRGRCRACRLPISPRYPLVELTLAVAFLLVGVSELHFACYTMPMLDPPGQPGFDQILIFGRWDICGVYLYHATLLTLLTGAALFSLDGNRAPVGYTVFALLVAAAAVIWPVLHPAAAVEIPLQDVAPRVVSGLSVLAGAGVGLTGGLILVFVLRIMAGVKDISNVLLMLVWTGAFLGWKMVLLAGPIVILSCSLYPLVYGRKLPVRILLAAYTALAAVVLLFHLDEWAGYPIFHVSPWIFAVVCGVFWPVSAVLLAMVTRYCHYPTVEYP